MVVGLGSMSIRLRLRMAQPVTIHQADSLGGHLSNIDVAGYAGCFRNSGRLSISLFYKPWEFLRANTEFRCAHFNRDVGGGSKLE